MVGLNEVISLAISKAVLIEKKVIIGFFRWFLW